MKGLILSGGKGTRLHPITYTSAKQLIPVANKPVLFYAIETLVAAGIYDIGIVVGDTHAEIAAAIGDSRRFGHEVCISYIQQEKPLGLAHAVKIARSFIKDERFIMFLGDNFIEEDIRPIIKQFVDAEGSANAYILLKHVQNPQSFGVALLADEQGHPINLDTYSTTEKVRIVRLIEKPEEPVSNFALVGIYLFDQHIFAAVDAIQPSLRGELEITDAIQYLIEHDYYVQPYFLRGYWIDTGKMQDILTANRTVLSHIQSRIDPGASIDEHSQLDGEVILEEHARLENSTVRGPSIIGRYVTLRDAYIGPFTSVYHHSTIVSSEIEHSIVLEECDIRNIEGRIEDSLIGRHVQIHPSAKKPHAYKLLLGDHSQIGLF